MLIFLQTQLITWIVRQPQLLLYLKEGLSFLCIKVDWQFSQFLLTLFNHKGLFTVSRTQWIYFVTLFLFIFLRPPINFFRSINTIHAEDLLDCCIWNQPAILAFWKNCTGSPIKWPKSCSHRYSYLENYSTGLIVGTTDKQPLLETPGEVNLLFWPVPDQYS